MIQPTERKERFSHGLATGASAKDRRKESWPTSTTVSIFVLIHTFVEFSLIFKTFLINGTVTVLILSPVGKLSV